MKASALRKVLWMTCILTLVFAGSASALSVTDTATGALIPNRTIYPGFVQNGDFTITGGGPGAPIVGDGIDEYTTWVFDFTADPGFGAFSASAMPLTSALLKLTLTPRSGLITTDFIRIEGLSNITDPIQSLSVLPLGVTTTVEIELLDHYSSADILNIFSPGGILPMYYHDDAILSYAELILQTQTVPEPASLILVGVGLLGIAVLIRKKR